MTERVRAVLQADLSAARAVGAGGYDPQRWEVNPPVEARGNPEGWWTEVISLDRLTGEGDDRDVREDLVPVALVRTGRREWEHVVRHDPRTEVARAEAVLAVLDACEADGGELAREIVRLVAGGWK